MTAAEVLAARIATGHATNRELADALGVYIRTVQRRRHAQETAR